MARESGEGGGCNGKSGSNFGNGKMEVRKTLVDGWRVEGEEEGARSRLNSSRKGRKITAPPAEARTTTLEEEGTLQPRLSGDQATMYSFTG
jgi:hypothetical protein